MRQDRYIPGSVGKITSRKERFDAINRQAQRLGDAWLVSVPGEPEIRIETLPNSALPEQLRELGYRLTDNGTGERILPSAITEAVLIEGSTRTRTVTHAGIARVRKFSLILPSSK